MTVVLLVVGGSLLALVAYDAAVTTVWTSSGGGPLTQRLGRAWWRAAHRLAREPSSPVLTSAGPAVLIATIVTWLALLWLGWTLVFSADSSAVVASSSGQPADWSERAYFAGFTAFTLGIGDFVPASAPWQLMTVVATASGLGLTTAAITYLVPVVTAATQRRAQAATIAVLGGDPHGIVREAYLDGSVRYLEPVLIQLTSELLLTAERHLSYPILHFFHPRAPEVELRIQLADLDDALILVEHGLAPEVVRPHPSSISGARAAMSQLIARALTQTEGSPRPLELTPLRDAGIPVVDDETFARRLEAMADRRARMNAYADESMWSRRD